MTEFWLHPSLILILGALLLPLVPTSLRRGFLLLVPLLVFARIATLEPGTFGQVQFLDWVLVFGRKDGRIEVSWGFGRTIGPPPVLSALRKALTSDALSTRYLPSLSEESAYMTTKKANSSVMKSA